MSTYFLATPLGKKVSVDSKPNSSFVIGSLKNSVKNNIIEPSVEHVPEDVRMTFEKRMEEQLKLFEEQQRQQFFSCYKVNRDGSVIQVKQHVLSTVLPSNKVQHANLPPSSSNYFASTTNSHVDVARTTYEHDAIASNYSDNSFRYVNSDSDSYLQNTI